ncbi:hypothetical protein PAXINDRAFT_169415 [Paxillus involutus ATCC 200175]|uniref:F-box domain-containing protein n=1 Tax=Paxillus involutus ATCC 200175 TaxID=664439 RepID=A0A0C9U6H2_PAXIN|nr:hypothetical protein PAXINDRAFT_169415 [Paxillus involutus ATCC 200175]
MHQITLDLHDNTAMGTTEELRSQLQSQRAREAELLKELADIQAEIRSTSTNLNHLVQSHATPPIERVPDEILVYILEQATSYRAGVSGRYSPAPADSWTWLGVSRHWHSVISAAPTLWTVINLTMRWTPRMLSRQLANSHDMPLDIIFQRKAEAWPRWYNRDIAEAPQRITSLFAPLSQHSYRWRSLSIREPRTQVLRWMLTCFETITYTPVEGLLIECNDQEQLPGLTKEDIPWPVWINCDTCPQLKRLHLGVCSIPDPLPPIHNLTSLTLIAETDPTTRPRPLSFKLRDALSSAFKLVSLTLFGSVARFGDMQLAANSIPIPTLRELKLYPQDIVIPGLESLIMAIDAPDLDRLEYVCSDGCDILRPAFFMHLGAPKFPSLRCIRLKDCVNDRFDPRSFAPAFPMLSHAALGKLEVSTLIARSPRPIDGWRELESLTLINLNYTSMNHVSRWLEERNAKGGPTLCVKLEEVASTSDFLESYNVLLRHAVVDLGNVKLEIGKAKFRITPDFQVEPSEGIGGIVSALGGVQISELVPCEDDDGGICGLLDV